MKTVVVYFGIIRYPDKNAMCHRVKGIKKSIEDSGYSFIQIGVNEDVRVGEFRKVSEDVYEINEPMSIGEWVYACVSAKAILLVLKHIGLARIKAVIMADYRFVPMCIVKKNCEKNAIKYVIDVMDWFDGGKALKSKIKKVDNILRMKYLYPKVKRRIYICSAYEELIGMNNSTVVVPGTTIIENSEFKRSCKKEARDRIVLCFAGQPGKCCEKEKIDWVIKSIYQLGDRNKYEFIIAGITKEEFISDNDEKYLTDNIHFLGRISHEKCIDVLNNSDFSIVIRPKSKLSEYGFSTKIGEAFAYGVPVIATDTSDNQRYIINGVNGYICECDFEAVNRLLISLNSMERIEIDRLKKSTNLNNPLCYKNYTKKIMSVIEN